MDKKVAASHRYNCLPLLPSGPGGFSRSWSCRYDTKVRQILLKAIIHLFFPEIKSLGLESQRYLLHTGEGGAEK